MMRLQELTSEADSPTVYHGSSVKITGTMKPPLFVTTSKKGAAWYAQGDHEHVKIYSGKLKVNKPLDIRGDFNLLLDIAADAGVDFTSDDSGFHCDEIEKLGYDAYNPSDLVHLPKVIAEVKERGYDCIHLNDAMLNGFIETYVLLDPDQFEITGTETPTKD